MTRKAKLTNGENARVAFEYVCQAQQVSRNEVCTWLGTSTSAMYRAFKEGGVSLPCAHKLEILTSGKYLWNTVVREDKLLEINQVKKYITA